MATRKTNTETTTARKPRTTKAAATNKTMKEDVTMSKKAEATVETTAPVEEGKKATLPRTLIKVEPYKIKSLAKAGYANMRQMDAGEAMRFTAKWWLQETTLEDVVHSLGTSESFIQLVATTKGLPEQVPPKVKALKQVVKELNALIEGDLKDDLPNMAFAAYQLERFCSRLWNSIKKDRKSRDLLGGEGWDEATKVDKVSATDSKGRTPKQEKQVVTDPAIKKAEQERRKQTLTARQERLEGQVADLSAKLDAILAALQK